MDNVEDINIKEVILKEIRKQIDEEYTEYKYKCLKDLDNELETNRNKTISKILDGIDILYNNNQPYSLEPIIQIKIEKKVILKENK